MRNFLIIWMLLVVLISCDSKQVLDTYETLPVHWGKSHQVTFKFKDPDTINRYNLFLNLRNTDDYAFSNLYLIVALEAPNGDKQVDTLEYQMANPDGTWIGTGMSSVKENKLWYKENVRFKSTGEYRLSIAHAMRKNGSVLGVEELEGITEVGFRIEKTIKEE